MTRKLRRRGALAAAALVLLVGAGTTYAVAAGEDVPRYRTTTAILGDVEQTLSSSGVVDAAARADLSFGTEGKIAKLKVSLGEKVKAGQVLAVLDTAELDAAVTEAEASVAKAVAQLASDRAAQTATVTSVSNPLAPAGDKNAPEPTKGGTGSNTQVIKNLQALQDRVITAQSAASKALAAAKAALATQVEVCAAANEPAEPSDETAAEVEDAEPQAEQDPCAVALAEVADRQQEVSVAQDALAAALNELAGALTKALGTVTRTSDTAASGTPVSGTSASGTSASGASASGTGASSSGRAAASTPSTSNPTSSASSPSGATTITAARLAADQAQIEQAKADLVTAQQARAQATLRSTRAGTVVALDAAVGDSVSTGTTVITVVGGQAVIVEGTASEAQIDQLKVGQVVRVTVPGSATAADGRVTAIGWVADTSSGTTSYPFTVTVDDPAIALPTGSRALLAVVTATASDVVTVPTSAVARNGDAATVKVIDGAKVTSTNVTLGSVGTRTVAIARGLSVGQKVVLAAIDDPITGADSELNQRGGFGGVPPANFPGPGGGGGPVRFSAGG